ncbi:MAG: LemA family protein [Flavobacteriales bacterium]
MKKTGCSVLIVLAVVIGGFAIWGITTYNGMVKRDQGVKTAWSKVESAYQRRADLIPNLVNTVKGAADFEKSTLTAVIQARASATSIKIDPAHITPQQLRQFQQAQGALSNALSRLMVTVERYPELKANRNYLALQSQLEGTENRIKVERDRFNDSVKGFNTLVKTFPNKLLAGIFGFQEKGYFQSDVGAQKAPEVKF